MTYDNSPNIVLPKRCPICARTLWPWSSVLVFHGTAAENRPTVAHRICTLSANAEFARGLAMTEVGADRLQFEIELMRANERIKAIERRAYDAETRVMEMEKRLSE